MDDLERFRIDAAAVGWVQLLKLAACQCRMLRQEYIDMGYGVLPEGTTQRFRSDQ